jgi:hypothetical protein
VTNRRAGQAELANANGGMNRSVGSSAISGVCCR